MIGQRIGHYDIVERIGAGGMGEVFLAHDTELGRDVAVKALPPAVAADPERLARFEREARVLASLNHPNIAHLYGLERQHGTAAFLVMELVDGDELSAWVARGPVRIDDALGLAKQLADALEAAHDKGIVHRDLKPANIKITPAGIVKVLDFGLAKAEADAFSSGLSQSPTVMHVTQNGVLLGTPAYMSPEQARGQVVDKRADIWAFGCVLYELLTGEAAFPGPTISDRIAAILEREPDWAALPPATPPSVRRLLRRCLAKDLKRRVPDIAVARFEIDEALDASRSDSGIAAASALAPRRRWPGAAPAIVASALAAAIASLVTWAAIRAAPQPRPVTRFAIIPPPAEALAFSVNDRDLSLSADGTRVVYTAGLERQLMVRPLDKLTATPLAGVANARAPFLSPDGRWVAFFDRFDEGFTTGAVPDGLLRRVALAGGAPSTVCTVKGGSRGASWGAADSIVFATSDPATGLMQVAASGGTPTVLTMPDSAAGEVDHQFPSVLPDGRGVLFTIVTAKGGETKVAVLDSKTRRSKVLVQRGSHPEYVASGHLVYVIAGTLWGARFDLATLAVLGEPVPLVERVMAQSGGNFSLSRTGTLVYAPEPGGSPRTLVWVDRSGRQEPVGMPEGDYGAIRLSPDATRVAFGLAASPPSLWIWDLGRRTSTRLAVDADGTNPNWSPDGRFIFFSTGPVTARTLARHLSDGSGSTERLFTSPGNHRPTSVSPDGATLVYEHLHQDSGYDLMTIRLDGKSEHAPLVATKFDERNATLSRDGRWVAYESNESGRDQVYVRPFPNVSAGAYQISTTGGRAPVWAVNGREVFFADGYSLRSAPLEFTPSLRVGSVSTLFEDRSLLFDTRLLGGSTIRAYDISREGRFIALKQSGGDRAMPTSIIVVQNWTDELRSLLPRP